MQTDTHTDSARSGDARPGPLAPRVGTCDPRRRAKLLAGYRLAYRWALSAANWLKRWVKSPSLPREWNAGVVGRLFGPFRVPRLRKLVEVVRGVLDRFARGYSKDGRRVPTTLLCFPATYHRCRTGLLGNATIFGTLRFCPQLLERGVAEVAKVVLHEMLHQGLGVGDRRHESCEGSKNRCYREGARALVESGRYDLAGRNIDNYVALMRLVGNRAEAQ